MARERPRISVIIVNHNGGELLVDCVAAAIASARQSDYELLLVDNCSTDGSLSKIESGFPEVSVIKAETNWGFAKANNLAIRRSRGKYVALVNPDVIMNSDSLATLADLMDAERDVGICGPRISLPDGRLDPACRRSFKTPSLYFYHAFGLSSFLPKSRIFGKYNLTYLPENQLADVDSISGAFMMIRRSLVDMIGLLDEDFFIYGEDEDWCFRVKQSGYRVVYEPSSEAVHVKSDSASRRPVLTSYHWHRAAYVFHRKHLASGYPTLINLIVYSGMTTRLGASMAGLALAAVRRMATAQFGYRLKRTHGLR